MRIKLNFNAQSITIPNNQSFVNRYIHQILGADNDWHDAHSDYCISRLCGGRIINNGKDMQFDDKAFLIITSDQLDFINQVLSGCANQSFGFGISFCDIQFIEEKINDGFNYFKTMDNGFIIKRKEGGFYTLNDHDFVTQVKAHVMHKFSKIDPDLDWTGFDIEIPEHKAHKVRSIYVKQVKNLANVCQFKLSCSKKLAKLIYNRGIGQSTGSGFGTIYKTENHAWYI